MDEFDLIILGAGSGGYDAGMYAHRRGLKVAFVDLSPETVGGCCLNRGCIPSKFMRHGARLLEKFSVMPNYGINPKGYELNIKKLKEERNKAVTTIRENFKKFASQIGIPFFYGKGVLVDKNTIFVEGINKYIKGKYILVSVGSSPKSIGNLVADGKYVHDTDTIWEIEYIPKKVIIVGGGAVGVEFAYIFRMYGSDVMLVELMDRLLPAPGIPEESGRYLTRKLKKLGVDIKLKTSVSSWEKTEKGVVVKLSDNSTLEADFILLAVGRKPNTEGIGLENVGIERDERGFVKVNDYCQTTVENVYACGDITSPLMLAHKSMHEGKIAVNRILGELDQKRNDSLMPKIVYSAYEVASVGLTEDEAEDLGYDVKTGVISFIPNPKAMIDSDNEGFIRLVVDGDSGKILGCHIVGPEAGELIHQVLHFMKWNLGVENLAKSIYSHPSLSESIIQSAMEVHFGSISWAKRHH